MASNRKEVRRTPGFSLVVNTTERMKLIFVSITVKFYASFVICQLKEEN